MCARCVLALGRVLGVLGRVLGLVVAGRFWCSYAWVSLTPTARVRPRAPVIERVRFLYRACAFPIGVCAGVCVGSV